MNGIEIHPERTALHRHELSHPVKTAIAYGYLNPQKSFFDYGCGRGEDVTILRSIGYLANGFDPFFFPSNKLLDADVVALSYVLNVIPDPLDRVCVLLAAWNLTKKTLIVAACVENHGGISYGDGEVSERGTFQHHYTHNELAQLIQQVTGKMASHIDNVFFLSR